MTTVIFVFAGIGFLSCVAVLVVAIAVLICEMREPLPEPAAWPHWPVAPVIPLRPASDETRPGRSNGPVA